MQYLVAGGYAAICPDRPEPDYPLLEDYEVCGRCGEALEPDDDLQLCKHCRVELAGPDELKRFAMDNLDKQTDFFLRFWALGKPPIVPVVNAARAIFYAYNSQEEQMEILREYALEHKKEFLEELLHE